VTPTFDVSDDPVPGPGPAKFPAVPYTLASAYGQDYLEEMARVARAMDLGPLDRAAEVLLDAIARDAVIFSCGNGGSAAIANHLQCDHLKTARNGTDITPRVVSLSTSMELVTAIANDIGYEDVFVYQLQSQARPGDVLVAISSSGSSPNIVRAIDWARHNNVRTIALTGFSGGGARSAAEVAVHVPSDNYGVVEDMHQALMHTLAQYLRQSRMTAAQIAKTTF